MESSSSENFMYLATITVTRRLTMHLSWSAPKKHRQQACNKNILFNNNRMIRKKHNVRKFEIFQVLLVETNDPHIRSRPRLERELLITHPQAACQRLRGVIRISHLCIRILSSSLQKITSRYTRIDTDAMRWPLFVHFTVLFFFNFPL